MKLHATTFFFLGTTAVNAAGVWDTIGEHIRSRPNVPIDLGNLGAANLDYSDNHPFERRLQPNGLLGSTNIEYNDQAANAVAQRLRIKFITDPIEQRRGESPEIDAKIDDIINNVLPSVSETWNKHLSVFPVASPILVRQDICLGGLNGSIPLELETDGVIDADLVILVSSKDVFDLAGEPTPLCGGTTIAVAAPCVLDQFDRPVVGFVNFCLPSTVPSEEVEPSDPTPIVDISDQESFQTTLVAIHEVGHVLGVGSILYPLFRDPVTGEPLTPRPLESRPVQCVDGSVRNITFPSENTLRLGETSRGEFFYDMVTPRIQQVTRNHYNCQSLPGARLESQPTLDDCSGQHFDERTLFNEIMSGIGTEGVLTILSPITLALMEDSGWYHVDYSGLEDATFGYGSGCDFVNSDCIIDNKVAPYAQGDYCDTISSFDATTGMIDFTESAVLCDPSNVAFAVCDLFDIESEVIQTLFPPGAIPDSNRFFDDHPTWQPSTAQYDGCPIAAIVVGGINCQDQSTRVTDPAYEGEEYGSTSRCVDVARQGATRFAGCFSTVCDESTRRVTVAGHECEFDGQEFEVTRTNGDIATATCPKLSTVCPQFHCQSGCSGRGICNFESAKCECFDKENVSPICAVSTDQEQETTAPPSNSAVPSPTKAPSSTSNTASPSATPPSAPSSATPMPTSGTFPRPTMAAGFTVAGLMSITLLIS